MARLEWFAKPFGPGDLDGEGALKLLGQPDLHPVAILVRETAQNSWDARLGEQTVRFSIHAHTLKGAALRAIREQVFANPGRGTGLSDLLEKDSLPVLEISDRGTSGLGGPVRNDRTFSSDEDTDYIDFVLSVGAKRDKELGGGTYGFGKTITYIASRAHTTLIWSHCRHRGRHHSRLVGSAMGDTFELRGKRYTGRQWWGQKAHSLVEPLTGKEADSIASKVFRSRFSAGESGTSILIVGPCLADSLEETIALCREAIHWYLWPKLVPECGARHAPMKIGLKLEGERVTMGAPRDHAFLRGFVDALQAVRAAQRGDGQDQPGPATTVEPIEIQRPAATLGHLAITRTIADPRERSLQENDDDSDLLAPITGNVHHIALMRHEAELIVNYRAMKSPALDGVDFSGVFRCTREVDDYFAHSEPPAHDAWEPKSMRDRRAKRHVNVALREMKKKWEASVLPGAIKVESSGSVHPEGYLANVLADLVPGLSGERAGPVEPGPGKPRRPGRERREGALHIVGNRVVVGKATQTALVYIELEGESLGGRVVKATAGVGFEGGTDRVDQGDVVVRGFIPGHIENLQENASRLRESDRLYLKAGGGLEWTVVVDFADGRSADIDLVLLGREASV